MIIWERNQAFYKKEGLEVHLGELTEGWFVSRRFTKTHYFYMFKGWGFNKELLDELKVPEIRLVIDNGQKVLIAKVSTIKKHGVDYQAPDYEPQLILAEDSFDRVYKTTKGELGRYV